MPSAGIAIIIEYQVSEQNRAVFLQALQESSAATLKDDGCLRMEISLPDGGDGRSPSVGGIRPRSSSIASSPATMRSMSASIAWSRRSA